MPIDLHVIVREAGERTADCCCTELVRQTTARSVSRVELTPFWRTLREGLVCGLNSGASWILSVDADVIPAQDAIRQVAEWIDRAKDRDGVITGMVQDKFIGGIRFGGVRLYRAKVIPDVLDLMPHQGENVRPESSAISRLAERGWRHETVPHLVGLHDYEQYYRDIYRKAFLHMQKHAYAAGRFLVYWKDKAADDLDYRAALNGAADALLALTEVDCDVSHSVYKSASILKRMGIKEKSDLTFDYREYYEEVRRCRESLDAGEMASASPPEQEAFDSAMPGSDVLQRIGRIGTNMKFLAQHSPAAQSAVLHQVRRALTDQNLLNTFSPGELVRHLLGRIRRSGN